MSTVYKWSHLLTAFAVVSGEPALTCLERNSSSDQNSSLFQHLRSRDGCDGRDGALGRDGRDGERGHPGPVDPSGPQGPPGPPNGGMVYTCWGRTTCPLTSGTQLVYEGKAAGSRYNHKGGSSDILCMPEDLNYAPGVQGKCPSVWN